MKQIRILSIYLCLFFCFARTYAQTYYFANPTLVSGTALKAGAVYRFSKVRPTTDALVTINKITGTISLGTPLDQTTTGWDSAFQPTLVVPALSNGYVEFQITFVATGTSTPQTQTNIAATALDIDGLIVGKDSLFEFDMLDMGAGSYINYNTLGGQLTITQSGTAYTAQTHTGANYPGIDTTAAATAVMFTDISSSMTTMVYRTGVINNINEVPPSRVASLYFRPFTYPNSNIVLPVGPLASFSGNFEGTGVQLDWLLEPDSKVDTIFILRSTDGKTFADIGTVDGDVLTYRDNASSGQLFYRLKLHQATGAVTYSDVIPIHTGDAFNVAPNPVKGEVIFNIAQDRAEGAVLLLVDTRGQVALREELALAKGPQTVHVNGLERLSPGIYVMVLKTGEGVYRRKIVKE